MSLGTKDTLELFHERTVRLDIVDLFATYLELNALRVEGLFRVPGEQAGVKHLLQRVARNGVFAAPHSVVVRRVHSS